MIWNEFLVNNKNSLAKQLTKIITALKKLRKYVSTPLIKKIAAGIFMSKIHYGMEMWVAAPFYLKKKMQSIHLTAARAVIGYKSYYWSTEKLLRAMGWLPIEKLLTVKLAHQIMQTSILEVLSFKIKTKISTSQNVTRLTGLGKFGPRPKEFGRTQITKYQFKSNLFDQYPKINDKIIQIKSKKNLDYGKKKYLSREKNIPTV